MKFVIFVQKSLLREANCSPPIKIEATIWGIVKELFHSWIAKLQERQEFRMHAATGWVVANLQGDRTASSCTNLSGHEVSEGD